MAEVYLGNVCIFLISAAPGIAIFIAGCRRWGWGWWRSVGKGNASPPTKNRDGPELGGRFNGSSR